jgi:putative ABC transport system permease protein
MVAGIPIVAGSIPLVGGLLAVGLVPLRGIGVIPIAGILIGGVMTATSLAGRRALDEITSRRGEVEAGRARVPAPRRDTAGVPSRCGTGPDPGTGSNPHGGLGDLPRAFVGVLLGGASPLTAGTTQLFVLVGLLAVEAVAIVVTVEIVARG